MEAVYNTSEVNDRKPNRVVVLPHCKANLPIQRPDAEYFLGEFVEMVAYAKNIASISNYHLKCTTKIDLETLKRPNQPESQGRENSCGL
jgi:hypothetical protein